VGDIIEKAKALQRLRDGASTPAEAQAAALVLTQYLDKHRLTEAELFGADLDAFIEAQEPIMSFERDVPWKRRLVEQLALHYNVAILVREQRTGQNARGKRTQKELCLIGHKSDIETVQLLFGTLCVTIERLALKARHKRSFRLGFVLGLAQQLERLRKQPQEASQQCALALSSRILRAEELLAELYPDAQEHQKNYAYEIEVESYEMGIKQGENVHLGKELDEKTEH
jgi:hypothetical protein